MTQRLTQKAKKPGSAAATVAAITAAVLLALAAADLVFAVIAPLEGGASVGRNAQTAERSLDYDPSILTRSNIFEGAPETVELPPEENIPVTSLRFVLTSTAPSEEGESSALIKTEDGREQPFVEGEEIRRGVTLERVETFRVIITRNGRREALLLANRPEVEDAEPVRPMQPDEDDLAAATQEPEVPAGDGRTVGAMAGENLPILELQGFEANDVVVAIEGQAVRDGTTIEDLITRYQSEPAVSVTVIRDGRREDITFILPQGSAP